MDAQEMFEKLGYELNKTSYFLLYKIGLMGCYVKFYVYDGQVSITSSYSLELHQAIHQQLIELGWI